MIHPDDVAVYTAAWNPEENEVTVVRDIPAGISGPFGSSPATSREESVEVLASRGYLIAGDWEVAHSGEHWVPLTRLK